MATGAGWVNAQTTEFDELDTPPKPIKQPAPKYPQDELYKNKMGAAVVEFEVNTDGAVQFPRVVAESESVFGYPAMTAVSKWKFIPGMKNGKPTAARMVVPIYFTIEPGEANELIAQIRTIITGFPPESPDGVPERYRYDTAPEPTRFQAPVWPWINGKPEREGTADVFYVINEKGRVMQARVVSASSPAFGKAAQAAVECWRFTPATLKGKPMPALGRRLIDFYLTLPADASERRLVKAIERGKERYAKASDLDAPLKPLSQVAAQYPMALILDEPSGSATIECIIDQYGRVCLPRIVSASREEFGWAAATAAAQWRFAPPTVRGDPVDVKVQIPFTFKGRGDATD
ncbi:MAG: TonB family protein [Opitutaceae bacterium]